MNQSNTPRTDAFYKDAPTSDFWQFARQLETELADANKRVGELLKANTQLADEVYQLSHKIASQQTLAKFDQMKGKL